MAQTAIQLYTLRDVDLPFDALLEEVAAAGFDGVEFAYRVTEEDPAVVADVLDDTGLTAAGAHVGLESLESDPAATLDRYRTLDCSDIVVPWLDPEYFASRDGIQRGVERLRAAESAITESGFHYHNHDHEFTAIDGDVAFDLFLAETDLCIELDLGLALAGGDDPVARLRSLGERCRLAHVKDVDREAGESAPLGTGDLPLSACADAFAGEWLVYEYEGTDPLDSLDAAGRRMRELC